MPVALIVEDGTGVAGANSFLGLQAAAQFFSERGALIPAGEASSAAATFAPGGSLAYDAGAFAAIPVSSILEISGAAESENIGFGYLTANDGATLALDWLTTTTEAPGATVRITWFEQSGWWHAAQARLVSALINGAAEMRTRYRWPGRPKNNAQPMPWPRTDVSVLIGDDGADAPANAALLIALGLGGQPAGLYSIPDDVVPAGVGPCQAWLALADLDAPLQAPVDPQQFLVSKSIGTSGIQKTFGGLIRRRRFPHADAEVAYLLRAAAAPSGPFYSVVRV